MRKTNKVILVSTGIAAPLLLAYIVIDTLVKRTSDIKNVREATAIVMWKEHRVFDESNHSYSSELGSIVERKPGDEEWRVFYRIIDFGQFDEKTHSRLLEAEKKRIDSGDLRFTFRSSEWFERTEIGDTLKLSCQRFGDDTVWCWSAENTKFPSLR